MRKLINFIIIPFLIQIFFSCSDEPSIDDLEFTFINGYINANLGPVIPPDPISCQLEFNVKNTNFSETISNINIKDAEVYLIRSNQKLGDIDFITTWDGILNPREETTVVLEKPMGQNAPFESPCGQGVFINVIVREKSSDFIILKVDSLMFTCTH